jgi:hypothetical protein
MAQHIVYLMNLKTMDRYSYPTGTIGGAIAVGDLVDKTKWMRKFRGAHVYPVVALSDTFMKTRFGGRQRPHFIVKDWKNLGPDKKALPEPKPPALESGAPEKVEPVLRTVEGPSLSEQMGGDEIPPFDDPISEILDTPKPEMTKSGVQKIAGARR